MPLQQGLHVDPDDPLAGLGLKFYLNLSLLIVGVRDLQDRVFRLGGLVAISIRIRRTRPVWRSLRTRYPPAWNFARVGQTAGSRLVDVIMVALARPGSVEPVRRARSDARPGISGRCSRRS